MRPAASCHCAGPRMSGLDRRDLASPRNSLSGAVAVLVLLAAAAGARVVSPDLGRVAPYGHLRKLDLGLRDGGGRSGGRGQRLDILWALGLCTARKNREHVL